jgi:amidophosphoribosyltransferase
MKRIFFISFLFLSVLINVAEEIQHECGVALVCLRKPLEYYYATYGDYAWGTYKICSLIEEQRNRGQDGAGIATLQFDMPAGQQYLHRARHAGHSAVDDLLHGVFSEVQAYCGADAMSAKKGCEFIAERYVGHVRYATHSNNGLRCCQPYLCKNSVASKNFALAGNFNMTNCQQLCNHLEELGLAPTSAADTHIILEMLSYYLKQEHVALAQRHADLTPKELTAAVTQELDIVNVVHTASKLWDGGYVFAGILGNGDAFICRDPAGIRPGFLYVDDEVIAAASERVALVNAFNVQPDTVCELKPGFIVVIKRDGSYYEEQFTQLLPERQCSFERIYFSRSCDPAIYQERKLLGHNLAQAVLDALGNSTDHALFAYVPNSSESAFIGLIEGLNALNRAQDKAAVHVEKLVYKNQRLRTFIASNRNDLVSRLYTVMRGCNSAHNTLVVVDDSIVRGTTLRESLMKELITLHPKKIIIVSSAPPVLYPDCYGIDMSQIGSFVGFQAAVALLKERGQEQILEQVYRHCVSQKDTAPADMINYVQEIYAPFSHAALCNKIAQLVRPKNCAWDGEIQIIYQTLHGLHAAMPGYQGDWYFTGNYPTPGGKKVLNTSYIQWYQGSMERAY